MIFNAKTDLTVGFEVVYGVVGEEVGQFLGGDGPMVVLGARSSFEHNTTI